MLLFQVDYKRMLEVKNMLYEELLGRINELAHKKKSVGLTAEEMKEQDALRKAYLKAFRASFAQTIEETKIVDTEGNDVTSEKVKKIQREKKLHNRQLEDE